jgi:hypothetical protein
VPEYKIYYKIIFKHASQIKPAPVHSDPVVFDPVRHLGICADAAAESLLIKMPDESQNHTAIWWMRRDIRLRDNAALETALSHARQVIPVFILDELLLAQPAPRRQAFLFNALHDLAAQLRARGSRLIIRRGRPRQTA